MASPTAPIPEPSEVDLARVGQEPQQAAQRMVLVESERRNRHVNCSPPVGISVSNSGPQGPLLLAVAASTPFKSPADLLSAARAKPGSLTYGSAGVGSVGHLATELLNDAAKVQMTHVPYKGAANAVVDLAAGRIDVMVSSYSTLAPLMKSGKVRALAVTSREAHPAFADLPPLAVSLPGFSIDIWVGVFAAAGTPAPLIERLNREINDISASSELGTILEPDGTVAVAMTPPAFATRVKEDLAQWKQIATEHKIVAE